MQEKQHGFIGINIFTYGLSPLTNTAEDLSATQRAQDFNIGWLVAVCQMITLIFYYNL